MIEKAPRRGWGIRSSCAVPGKYRVWDSFARSQEGTTRKVVWSGWHALSLNEAAELGRPFLGLDIQTLANQGASSPASWLMVPQAQNLSLVIAFHNVFAPNQFHASVRTPPCTGGMDLPTTNLSACERVGSHIPHIQHNRYTEFKSPDTIKMHKPSCMYTRVQDTRVHFPRTAHSLWNKMRSEA